jgi:hypothetical protein
MFDIGTFDYATFDMLPTTVAAPGLPLMGQIWLA